MNEITLVRRVRPEVPEPDPAVKARAWARLQTELDPAPSRRRLTSRRTALRIGVGGVVAAGAAGTIVATQLSRAEPSAAQTLEQAARAVEHGTPVPRPRPGQWVYTRKISAYALAGGNVVGPEAMLHGRVRVEEWWRFDGTAMASSVQGGRLEVKGILPDIRSRPPRNPRYDGYIGGPGIVDGTPHKLYDYVAGLPGDPDALLARVRRDYRDGGEDVTTFGVIARIFRDDRLIPPKATATLYRALAKISRVRVEPDVKDFAGRRGIGVIFDTGQTHRGRAIVNEIILDARDYRYLGDSSEALLSFGVVDEAGRHL
jgi:hypothetical protein